jgi:beta-glucosidase
LEAQGYDMPPAQVFQDNMSTIAMIRSGKPTSDRTRHINIRFFFINDKEKSGEVKVEYRSTKSMLADILINRLFFEPIIGKGYPIESIKLFSKSQKNYLKKDEHLLKTPLDFIGVQNYTRELFKYNFLNPFLPIKHIPASKRTKELTMMNWEIHPPSIYHTLIKLSQYQLNTPLYITENGIALNDIVDNNSIQDYQRIIFYQSHLQEVLNAKDEGVDIKGYFTWSLIDNFEWAEGYEPRFGLIHVDFVTKKRTLKESAHWFNQFLGRKP